MTQYYGEERRHVQLAIPVHEDKRTQRQEFSGSLGPWKWKFLGYDLTHLALVLALAVIVWIIYLAFESIKLEHKDILYAIREGNELQGETNYINSRPLDKRPDLPMPMSLFCKLYPTDERCVSWKR